MSAQVFFAIRDPDETGTGTEVDPYNGYSQASLDERLAGLSEYTTIHFGPGVFQTRGLGALATGWRAKSGQRIVGAGMHATVLRLVGAEPETPTPDNPTTDVAPISNTDPVENIEISDMTIDVNLAGQPKDANGGNPKITGNAISFLQGRNIHIKRVRIINWGTYNLGSEGFPIYIEGHHSIAGGNNVVEDCIIEQPDLNNAREVTLLNNHAGPPNPTLLTTARNNYINADFTTGSPGPAEPILSVTDNGDVLDTLTIKTLWPNRFQAGDAVRIDGSSNPALNGRFPVLSVADVYTFNINKPYTGTVSPGANLVVRPYTPEAMRVSTIAIVGNRVDVTTSVPHLRVAHDWVRIAGVLNGTEEDRVLNGAFQVASNPVPTTNTFSYFITGTPGTPATSSEIWLDRWPSKRIVIESPFNPGGSLGLRGDINGQAKVKTVTPHYKAQNDYVRINGVGGDDGNDPAPGIWNGYFKVLSVLSNRELVIKLLAGNETTSDLTYTAPHYQQASLEHRFQALMTTTGYGARAYGNRLVGLQVGGPYHDLGPGPTKDQITFNNYYYRCSTGIYSNIDVRAADDRENFNLAFNNIIDLQQFPVGAWNHAPPSGIFFDGKYPNDQEHSVEYDINTVLVHDNIIRFADDVLGPPGGTSLYYQRGVHVVDTLNAVVQYNIISFAQAVAPLKAIHVLNDEFSFNSTVTADLNAIIEG